MHQAMRDAAAICDGLDDPRVVGRCKHQLTDIVMIAFARSVRGHWGIENKLHWVLDVTMGEDGNRTSKDHGPENLGSFADSR